MKFNNPLKDGHVVLAKDYKWCDSSGEVVQAIVWSGSEVYTEIVQNGYVNKGDVAVDASADERAQAVEWHQNNVFDKNNLVGSVVKLKRSRKAPNNTDLLVVDHREQFFDSIRYRNYPEQVAVDVDGEKVWVSINCVHEIVKSKKPFWA